MDQKTKDIIVVSCGIILCLSASFFVVCMGIAAVTGRLAP